MSTKQTKDLRVQKAPKTIKVITVVKAVAVTVAIVASFIGGWFVHAQDVSRVTKEAATLVSTLKIDAK